jgi:hypothetical protein
MLGCILAQINSHLGHYFISTLEPKQLTLINTMKLQLVAVVFAIAGTAVFAAGLDHHLTAGFDEHHEHHHAIPDTHIDPIDVGQHKTDTHYHGHEERPDGHRSSELHDDHHGQILPGNIVEHPLGGHKYEGVADAVREDKGVYNDRHHDNGHDGWHGLHEHDVDHHDDWQGLPHLHDHSHIKDHDEWHGLHSLRGHGHENDDDHHDDWHGLHSLEADHLDAGLHGHEGGHHKHEGGLGIHGHDDATGHDDLLHDEGHHSHLHSEHGLHDIRDDLHGHGSDHHDGHLEGAQHEVPGDDVHDPANRFDFSQHDFPAHAIADVESEHHGSLHHGLGHEGLHNH